jgi:hypothetical protein
LKGFGGWRLICQSVIALFKTKTDPISFQGLRVLILVAWRRGVAAQGLIARIGPSFQWP